VVLNQAVDGFGPGRSAAVVAPPAPPIGAFEAPCRPRARAILWAVCRRLAPQLVEATLIPSVLFFACAALFGIWAAFLVALTWSYSALFRRFYTGQRVPALLLLATAGLSVRTFVALGSRSTFVYFFQPVVGTAVLGTVFLVSALIGRPLIARFAEDFCALEPDVACRPGVTRLYRRLTYLWAAVNFMAAATTLVLLQSLPLTTFVALRPVAMWVITGTGVVVTVTTAVRAAHHEGLLASIGANGALSAVAI
jgi:intracellular septation protein A